MPDKIDLILAHGCFDVLHIGHIRYLKAAKALGNSLIVTITADQYISKGSGRPVFNEDYRKEVLESLKFIDLVEILYEPTGVSGILKYEPDIYAKGHDYKGKSGNLDLERQAVESYGGKLVIIESQPQYSSTAILTGKLLKDLQTVNLLK